WRVDDATCDRTAVSFDNPDFVEVVIHSYRHRFGYAGGDPSLEAIERRLAAKPPISVPTIVLHGDGSGLSPPENSLKHAAFFTGPYQRRVIPTAGHNLPPEAPNAVADAVLELVRATQLTPTRPFSRLFARFLKKLPQGGSILGRADPLLRHLGAGRIGHRSDLE